MANKCRFLDKEIESILLESRNEDSDNSFFPKVVKICRKCFEALHFPDCFRVIKPLNFLKYQQNHAEQLG
ncbi:hypothetical protein C0J52_17104 [Blattella germanica]|nr:hypothetical protein C0J52_17104 [Blattella germanica]